MTAGRRGSGRGGRCGQGERDQLRVVGRCVFALLAAAAFLLAGGGESASAQFPPPAQSEVELDYTLSNVNPRAAIQPAVTYSSGVVSNAGSKVQIQSGTIRRTWFLSNGWNVVGTGTATLNFTVSDWRMVEGATITGTAYFPAGASMTVTNETTGQTITLESRATFSLPTGISNAAGKPPAGGKRFVNCHGSARLCRARIDLAGGVRDREIVIRLTSDHLTLRSIRHPAPSKHAAWSLTDGHFARARSKYLVILNAAQSSPRGSHLILTFGASTPP
jgi:hypothetical protein